MGLIFKESVFLHILNIWLTQASSRPNPLILHFKQTFCISEFELLWQAMWQQRTLGQIFQKYNVSGQLYVLKGNCMTISLEA